MEIPLCRAMYGTKGWMKFPNTTKEVVIVEVECTFRGVSMGEGCCCQGFGPQWSVLWVMKHLVTGADSLYRNLSVPAQNGQRFTWSEVARHHAQQVDANALVSMSQELQDQHCPAPGRVRLFQPLRARWRRGKKCPQCFPNSYLPLRFCKKKNDTTKKRNKPNRKKTYNSRTEQINTMSHDGMHWNGPVAN